MLLTHFFDLSPRVTYLPEYTHTLFQAKSAQRLVQPDIPDTQAPLQIAKPGDTALHRGITGQREMIQ